MMSRGEVLNRPWFGALSASQVQFAKRVYSLLALAMGVFTGAAWFAGQNLELFMPLRMPLTIALFATMFISMFVRRAGPTSGLFLFTIVTLFGFMLGPSLYLISQAAPAVVMSAGGLTIGIFLTLTAYVHISGQNFTYLYAFLFPALIGLLLVGLFGMFFGMGDFMHSVYSYVGAMIFTLYILADTSAITRQFFQANDAAGAALTLFLDILNLFLFLLSILSDRR